MYKFKLIKVFKDNFIDIKGLVLGIDRTYFFSMLMNLSLLYFTLINYLYFILIYEIYANF